MATEAQLRKEYVETAASYMGVKQWSKKHKVIIDLFNTVKPDGWSMTYNAFWCATFASAMGIKAFGKTKAEMVFPLSANCGTIINKAKAMGMWVENDGYKPKKGDWILYDWNDNGVGDNLGSPDHVGIVEVVGKKTFTVIEGNKNAAVGRRTIAVNGKYIRGFVVPKYSRIAQKHTNAWYFRKALRQVVAYMNKHDFRYVASYTKCAPTWARAKKKKVSNCSMMISYALQKAGFIEPGEFFWCNGDRITCKGGLTLKKLKKIAAIDHPHTKPKKMKKGDICGYKDNPHTMAYAGKRNDVPIWYSWSPADVGDKQPKTKPSYTDKKISTRIRLK